MEFSGDPMDPTPLTFAPILKPKVWGGQRLAGYGKDLGTMDAVGESWELADLPDSIEGGRSIIDHGPLAGKTLHSLLEEDPAWIMGRVPLSPEGGFPLLIKYLDARENLSMQVHPDADWVRDHPGDHLKTESWLVLEADAGALLYKGIREGVEPDQFARAIEDGSIVDLVETVPARVGECHDLPSGTCHALGAGILVAEIQTPSDTTFRVFDWGRTDRTLHVEQAMHCIAFEPVAPMTAPHQLQDDSMRTTLLSNTSQYVIERIDAITDHTLTLVPRDAPEVLMVLSGLGVLDGPGAIPMEAGRTILLPATLDSTEARLEAGASILRITIPDPE